MGEELLWYASYGSNMLRERFLCYIKGGKFRGRGEDKGGCRDTSLPLEDRPLLIPRQLYFARNSSTWGGRGVAFLDKDRPGLTLGRMYKITREQFGEVKSQEGDWYRYELALGDVDGIQVVTFTNESRFSEVAPGNDYLAVMREGAREMFPDWHFPDWPSSGF